jgi:hypothetical protein
VGIIGGGGTRGDGTGKTASSTGASAMVARLLAGVVSAREGGGDCGIGTSGSSCKGASGVCVASGALTCSGVSGRLSAGLSSGSLMTFAVSNDSSLSSSGSIPRSASITGKTCEGATMCSGKSGTAGGAKAASGTIAPLGGKAVPVGGIGTGLTGEAPGEGGCTVSGSDWGKIWG